jgi:flagellin-specific chaperone FliS
MIDHDGFCKRREINRCIKILHQLQTSLIPGNENPYIKLQWVKFYNYIFRD